MHIPCMESRRKYKSALREQQAEQTRVRILDALAEELVECGLGEISVPKVAKRAGVAVRTVYSHFPTKDELLDALGPHWDKKIDMNPGDFTLEEVSGLIRKLFVKFDENADMIVGVAATQAGSRARKRHRKQRTERSRAVYEESTCNLPEEEARRYHAVVRFLIGSKAWQEMREMWGMSGEESGEAVVWAVETLMADVEKRNNAAEKESS